MKLIELNKIFDIQYGNQFDLYKLETDEDGYINFVSRSSQNLGVVAKVLKYNDIQPFQAGLITVTLGGTYLLSSFVQQSVFYTAQNIKVLTPKIPMSFIEKLFYCKAIEANRFRYTSHGREANITLNTLLVPEKMPEEFMNLDLKEVTVSSKSLQDDKIELNWKNWKNFKYDDVFIIKKGKRLTKEDFIGGTTPFIGAIDSNNGYRDFIGQPPNHQENTITVNYNGSVGEAFYQPSAFWASDDVNVLYPKFRFNKYIAMFIIPLIKNEKYRFNYGRKWESDRMRESIIKLPVNQFGEIDIDFMENYIKSLPYSGAL